jgi:hypothetical protein
MARLLAIVLNNQVVELTRLRHKDIERDCDRLVDVSARPDIKVGTKWPFKTEKQAIADGDLKAPGVVGDGALPKEGES